MSGTTKYFAAAGANKVITTKPAKLLKILVGADVAASVIEVSNSATDGDGDVKLYFAGAALMTSLGGEVEVNASFPNGITADLTNQTNVTFVYINEGI